MKFLIKFSHITQQVTVLSHLSEKARTYGKLFTSQTISQLKKTWLRLISQSKSWCDVVHSWVFIIRVSHWVMHFTYHFCAIFFSWGNLSIYDINEGYHHCLKCAKDWVYTAIAGGRSIACWPHTKNDTKAVFYIYVRILSVLC